MQKYRERNKQDAAKKKAEGHQEPRTRKERREQELRRKQWRECKREQRAKLWAQKRRRVREKDRKAKQKARMKVKKTTEMSKQAAAALPFPSSSSKRKALSRVRKTVPKVPSRYASIVRGLIDSASSEVKLELQKQGIVTATTQSLHVANVDIQRAFNKSCRLMDRKQKKQFVHDIGVNLQDARYGLKSRTCQLLGVSRQYFEKRSRADGMAAVTRSDSISPYIN